MAITLTVGDQEVNLAVSAAEVNLSVQAAGVTLSSYIPGPAGPIGPPGTSVYTLETNSDIGGNRALSTEGNYAIYADSTDTSKPAIGISVGAVSSGVDVTVQSGAKMTVSSAGWVIDLPIYLSTNGTMTQVEPTSGFSQVLGHAYKSDVIIIDIQKPIIRS